MAMVVMGDTCVQSILYYYQATMLVVINCLRLFVVVNFVIMAMVVMGGMCTKYHGHSGYYVGNSA